MTSSVPDDPLARMEMIRQELRDLRTKHDDAARSFEIGSGFGAVLFNWGLVWAEDNRGIPTGQARDEADRLRLTWTESGQYRDLLTEFERLLDRARAELSTVFRGAACLGSGLQRNQSHNEDSAA